VVGGWFSCRLNTGGIYHWIKSQEVIKLYVVYNSLEILDRMLCSFGSDTLEALAHSCLLFSESKSTRLALFQDLVVCAAVLLVHAATLMCQAITFSVAVNSSNSNLIALLISNNFVEIKGSIFKKMDQMRLEKLIKQDSVELFHIIISLTFVLVESMIHHSSLVPPARALQACGLIFITEVVVDSVKYSFMSKYNALRPGLYEELQRDLAKKALSSHSGNIHREMVLFPHAAGALVIRILYAVLVHLQGTLVEDMGMLSSGQLWALVALAGLVALGVKIAMGLFIKTWAVSLTLSGTERLKKLNSSLRREELS